MLLCLFKGQVDNDEIQIPDELELPLKDQASVEAFDGFLRHDAKLCKSLVDTYCH